MLLHIIGTVKIDTSERLGLMQQNLRALHPIRDLFTWRINIAGKHAVAARGLVAQQWSVDQVTTYNDTKSTYQLLRDQTDQLEPEDYTFSWQEDHWFICPHPTVFRYLLMEYINLHIDEFCLTHLSKHWERMVHFNHLLRRILYTVYTVNLDGQHDLWWKVGNTPYVLGIPTILRAPIFKLLIEHNKMQLSYTQEPRYCELDPWRGELFLKKYSFTRFVPMVPVFQEVCVGQWPTPTRNFDILYMDALNIINTRDRKCHS